MKFSKNTIILIVCTLIVLGGGIYYFGFYTADQGSAITASVSPGGDAELTFINLASQLGPISFDTGILNDAHFLTLTDIRTTVVPELKGRKDPFAPITGVVESSGTTGTSAVTASAGSSAMAGAPPSTGMH